MLRSADTLAATPFMAATAPSLVPKSDWKTSGLWADATADQQSVARMVTSSLMAGLPARSVDQVGRRRIGLEQLLDAQVESLHPTRPLWSPRVVWAQDGRDRPSNDN